MADLPKDPVMLLSVVNTNLRDYCSTLDDFCKTQNIQKEELIRKLEQINYRYDENRNQFV